MHGGAPREPQRVLLCANTLWYLGNFRGETIAALRQAGFEVHCAGQGDDDVAGLEAKGAIVHVTPRMPSRISPLADVRYLLWLRSLVRTLRPRVVFSFTPKPNLYCGIVTRETGTTFVPNVSGLGRIFERESLLSKGAEAAYRFAFSGARQVVFQNRESLDHFVTRNLVPPAKARHLMGSGVDLARFAAQPMAKPEPLVFLFSGRLLPGKGIGEYIAAATAIAASPPPGRTVRFLLAGFTDATLGATISRSDLERMLQGSPVEYLGPIGDVRDTLAACHCFVLPSYYGEGVPRSVIEAAAVGRPAITTDHPGCRDTVIDGENGFLVPVRDSKALEAAMRQVAALSDTELAAMGERSRALAEERFDVAGNLAAYLELAHG
jgi:glycosyltransferase involved in cell wall biosynthesis